jgi:uncharacterized protein (TIGR03086 family)
VTAQVRYGSCMSDEAARFRRIADVFDERVAAVIDWEAPAPPEGWVARDVVRHLTSWVPGMFGPVGVVAEQGPAVDDDPVAAWAHVRSALQAALSDPVTSARTMQFGPAGEHTIAAAIDRFVTPDVLVHTWDLARASGQDDTLDTELSASVLAGFEAMGDALVASGHFGPAVPVAADAPVDVRLVAASGRDPAWSPPG